MWVVVVCVVVSVVECVCMSVFFFLGAYVGMCVIRVFVSFFVFRVYSCSGVPERARMLLVM